MSKPFSYIAQSRPSVIQPVDPSLKPPAYVSLPRGSLVDSKSSPQQKKQDDSQPQPQATIQQRHSSTSPITFPQRVQCAQQFRDATCPRQRIIPHADGHVTYSIGSHISNNRIIGAATSSQAYVTHTTTTYEKLPLWSFPVYMFSYYGLGVVLYFRFLRTLAILMLMMTLCHIPSLIITTCIDTTTSIYQLDATTLGNIAAPLIQAYTKHTNDTNFSHVTLSIAGNHMKISKQNISIVLTWMDTLGCIIFVICMIRLTRQQIIQVQEYARTEITVQQYTVQVRGLPPTFSDRFALQEHFASRFGRVVDVAIASDNGDLIELYQQRGKLRQQQDGALERVVDALQHKIDSINDEIDSYHRSHPHPRAVAAFVTFNCMHDRTACLTAYDQFYLSLFSQGMISPHASKLTFMGHVLNVTSAPEPSNILFRNIRYSRCSKYFRRLLTTLVYVGIMLLSIIVVFISQYYQRQFAGSPKNCPSEITLDEARVDEHIRNCYCFAQGWLQSVRTHGTIDCSSYFLSYSLSHALRVLAVLSIVIVNIVLKWIMTKLATFEKHNSVTSMQTSITKKLFLGLFINTGLVLLLVNARFQHYIADLGFVLALDGSYEDFVYDWFLTVGVSIILTMLINIAVPLLPVFVIPFEACRRKFFIPWSTSQSVLNEAYAGMHFELAERYAMTITVLYVTMVYSSGMPILLLIAAAFFAVTFFCDKLLFLRLYRIPPRFDESLALLATSMMPYALLLHLGMALWFYSAPVVTTTTLAATSSSIIVGADIFNHSSSPTSAVFITSTVSDYSFLAFRDRLVRWETAPLLAGFCITTCALVIHHILKFLGIHICQRHLDDSHDGAGEATRIMSFTEAKQHVRMENYHYHSVPAFKAAYARTQSGRQLAKETPIYKLEEEEKQQIQLQDSPHDEKLLELEITSTPTTIQLPGRIPENQKHTPTVHVHVLTSPTPIDIAEQDEFLPATSRPRHAHHYSSSFTSSPSDSGPVTTVELPLPGTVLRKTSL